ncbi:EAL domain-containing protein [Vibrio antiquarius]|uniref:bifunctional diguanylate cyclase/phosphodiesterase n=1 Tax=Vibrio antiquarius (strain Ex25) TaxID=150340 RepID=UPI00265A4438|nr:EAL domain-containing protein [Vibrio antiquarius]MCE9845501.1 EAL domain-containing protein [Vibrio antiquarius]
MRAFSKLVHDVSQVNDFLVTSQFSSSKQYLVQILSTQSRDFTTTLADAVLLLLPNAHVMGHSTRNVILEGEIFTSGCLISVTEFEQTTLTSAVQTYSYSPDIDGGELKRSLLLQHNSQVILSFAVQIERRDYPLFQTFASEEVVISGGLAQSIDDGCWVLYQNRVYDNAVVAVALHSDTLKLWTDAYSEWNPIGMPHKVTHAKGTRLYCLGEQKALDVYKRYLADGHDVTLSQLLSFPLYRESLGRKEVCTVTELHADGSMSFDRPWCLGDEVQFCYNHPSLTLEQVRHGVVELAMHQPEVVMIFNCASRLDFIDSSDEVQAFKDIATTFGSYCMGELHGGIGQPEILHHSLTYLAMREGDEVQALNLPKSPVSSSISPLFSLIRNAIGDLNHMNAHMGYQLDRQTRKLQESYRRDSRTGLQNRVALQERLSSIDLDEHLLTLKLLNFSHINEKYGYRVGDQLLKDLSMHFTNRLRKRFGMPTALQLYSIGVGEWAFIFKADQSSETIKQHFTRFADAVEQTNFEPIGLREIDYLSISLCGGLVSRRDFPSASADELLLKGIEARRSGVRSNTHICNAKDIEVSEDVRKEQLGWLSCVSKAILKQNIITYSQPIVHADSHKLASQECLVRILEEDGTVIAPGRFLPIISDTHLYTRLSRHMIHSTLHYMRDKQGDFSINLSPQDLLSDKTLMLLEHEICQLNDPRRIGLEVLESEQLKDYGRMIEACSHFRSLGARIIVDDFGSGYSNIDEILKLEPEVIKLDGSLIRDIDKDLKQRKIASQLVRLCQVFNAETVAEFVHNREVCKIAQDMGVDYLQGYYLGEPTRLF